MWKVTGYGIRSRKPYCYKIPGTLAANPQHVFLFACKRHQALVEAGEINESLDRRPGQRMVTWLNPMDDPIGKLTRQDVKLLRLVARGATAAEIRNAMHVSDSVTKEQLRRLRLLFGARDRAHLVAEVSRGGIDLLEDGMEGDKTE